MKKMRKSITAFVVVTLLALSSAIPASAGGEPSIDFSADFLSAYIWRGQELSKNSLVIQPSMTVGYEGFAANLWGNLDTEPYAADDSDNKAKWNETDLTLSYGRGFGMVGLDVGYIYYALDGVDDTQELYLDVGVDTLLSPTLTIYRDIATAPHTYFLLGISHAFQFTDAISLELGGSISYLASDDGDDYPKFDDQGNATSDKFNNFHDGVISAVLPIAAGDVFTITPKLSYVFPLSGDAENDMKARSLTGDDDKFWVAGVTVGMAF